MIGSVRPGFSSNLASGTIIPMSGDVPATSGTAAFAPVEELLRASVRERAFPGAAGAAGTCRGLAWVGGAGSLTYDAAGRTAGPDTLYDLASLTKVIATTSGVMRLVDAGVMGLATPVR